MSVSLRRTLVIRFGLTMAAALGVVALLVHRAVERAMQQEMEESLASTFVLQFHALSTLGSIPRRPDPVQEGRFLRDANRLVAVRAADGQVLQANTPRAESLPIDTLCLRQADLILVVAAAGGEPEPSPLHEQLFDAGAARSAAVQLVLLHPADTVRPSGTARWLKLFPVARHHHVRSDRLEDTRRVARFIAGKSVSAAFSGGGARALGHIGVVRALVDSGVPIDAVAGVSAGCFASALYAMGHDYETMLAVSNDSVGRYSARQEATLPIVSFLSGRRSLEMLRRMFDVQIEDLWVPFCCLSTNLTRAEVVTHDRGPLWLAVRA